MFSADIIPFQRGEPINPRCQNCVFWMPRMPFDHPMGICGYYGEESDQNFVCDDWEEDRTGGSD